MTLLERHRLERGWSLSRLSEEIFRKTGLRVTIATLSRLERQGGKPSKLTRWAIEQYNKELLPAEEVKFG